jgi:hypothetical protein
MPTIKRNSDQEPGPSPAARVLRDKRAKSMTRQQLQDQEQHTKKLAKGWLRDKGHDAEKLKTRIYVEDAKVLLGWTEVGVKDDFDLTDPEGKRIALLNNRGNRSCPGESQIMEVSQDILCKGFAFNGEPLIIGRGLNALSAQRRLLGLIFAEHRRTGPQAAFWKAYWDGPCYIEAVVIYNVDDSRQTIQTLDNTRKQTLADALYRDPDVQKMKRAKRKPVAKILERAIIFLWKRINRKSHPYQSRKTNAALLSWKDRHPGIVKAAEAVYDLDSKPLAGETAEGANGKEPVGYTQGISGPGRWTQPGIAAGLYYLMGTSASDREAYYHPKPGKNGPAESSEKLLDKSRWELAQQFWELLARSHGDSKNPLVKLALACTYPDNVKVIFYDGDEEAKAAVLVRMWRVFVDGAKPTPKALEVGYVRDADGVNWNVTSNPVTGGIDWGSYPDQDFTDKTPPPSGNGQKPAAMVNDLNEEQSEEARKIREEHVQALGCVDTGNLD